MFYESLDHGFLSSLRSHSSLQPMVLPSHQQLARIILGGIGGLRIGSEGEQGNAYTASLTPFSVWTPVSVWTPGMAADACSVNFQASHSLSVRSTRLTRYHRSVSAGQLRVFLEKTPYGHRRMCSGEKRFPICILSNNNDLHYILALLAERLKSENVKGRHGCILMCGWHI